MILWRIVDTVTSSDARTKAPSFLTLQVVACLGRKDLVFPPHEQYRYRLSYRDCSEEEHFIIVALRKNFPCILPEVGSKLAMSSGRIAKIGQAEPL
jgi:hypothetical protein